MAKMKNCKSCDKEVAKSAKVCPHCGQKQKMGFFAKAGIALILVVGAGIFLMPSSEEIEKQLSGVEQAEVANISPTGSLAKLFGLMSENTDIQRENMEKELKGKVIKWTLPVYEVTLKDKDKRIYKIQTSSKGNIVSTFINLYARDEAEVSMIESLIEGSLIKVKGKITGTFLRNIQIDQARLVK